jgi:hypothetical protein
LKNIAHIIWAHFLKSPKIHLSRYINYSSLASFHFGLNLDKIGGFFRKHLVTLTSSLLEVKKGNRETST